MKHPLGQIHLAKLDWVLAVGLGLLWAWGRALLVESTLSETLILSAVLVVFVVLVWGLGRYLRQWNQLGGLMVVPTVCFVAIMLIEIAEVEPSWLVWGPVTILYGWSVSATLPGRTLYPVTGLLAGLLAASLILAEQIGARFASEELFLLVEWAGLFGVNLILMLVPQWVWPVAQQPSSAWWRGASLAVPALALIVIGLWLYPASFYPTRPPSLYPGIDANTPWLCAPLPTTVTNTASVDSRSVYARWLERLATNERASVPEWGALALGHSSDIWAARFRNGLLNEAAQQRFTEPANSIKYGQYLAALRLYYYQAVRTSFPSLFSPDDEVQLATWFANINRRALTVEWSDWVYGWAFQVPPRGPYENQENGATLLTLLNRYDLSAPELTEANKRYLNERRWGWQARFRNSDDAVTYQLEWLTNAYLQMGEPISATLQPNIERSFGWLRTQALPGGAALSYNHLPGRSWAGIWLLGAHLTGDSSYVWLADQALHSPEPVFAQPGAEKLGLLASSHPDTGSCLVYGDSGIPTQVGPLAPDKIVFRDSWSATATYALLNLRFTGWHRYRATNTLTLLYQQAPVTADNMYGQVPSWFPSGRALFRDKRIPRENLNGLVVPRTGLSAVLHVLTGLGGPWAQDPPFTTQVEKMTTTANLTHSQTSMHWGGWQHQRQVWFYAQNGPLVVVDTATGPANQAAISWNLPVARLTAHQPKTATLMLQTDGRFAQLQILSDHSLIVHHATNDLSQVLNVVAQTTQNGKLHLVSVFLPDDWRLADDPLRSDNGQMFLHLQNLQNELVVPLWPVH